MFTSAEHVGVAAGSTTEPSVKLQSVSSLCKLLMYSWRHNGSCNATSSSRLAAPAWPRASTRKVEVGWVEGLQAHVTAEDQALGCLGFDAMPSAHIGLPGLYDILIIPLVSSVWHISQHKIRTAAPALGASSALGNSISLGVRHIARREQGLAGEKLCRGSTRRLWYK